MAAHQNRVLDMTRGNPARLLCRFAVPLLISNILQQCYNLADTSLAGHILGDTALAQIGATAALYGLIMNFAFGMNNGLSLTVSRSFGAGDEKAMRRGVCWTVTLSFATAAVLTAGFLLLRRPLLAAMQVPAETVDGALAYLTVILAGIPFSMLYNLCSALLRAVGNSITPLYFLVLSSALNIGLDVLFMGPLQAGVQGAAMATLLAQAVSGLLCAAYMIRSYPELHFTRREFKGSRHFVWEMFWAGLSMGLMTAIYNIGSVVLQSSINALGSVYIAAQAVARKFAELFFIPGGALGIGTATFSSQNYGSGRRSRILKGVAAAVALYLGWWVLIMIFVFTAAEPAVQAVSGTSDPEILRCAVQYLRISAPVIPPMAVLVILRNMLQGIRRTVEPLLASTLELAGKVVFGLWIVPVYGYTAVCYCEPITWVICFVFIVTVTFLCRREFKDV